MANEITITISALNTNIQDDFSPPSFSVDQTTLGADGGITIVGTGEENLTFTDVTTEGFFMMTNLDSSNFVTYGPDSTGMVAFGIIRAGHSALIQLDPATTFVWKADTLPVKVQWKLWEV
jgi:hypothetical protein